MTAFDVDLLLADRARLDRALAEADAATLTLVLVHLSGERQWLEEARPYVRGPMSYQETMPEEMTARVRARLVEVLEDYARSGRDLPPFPQDDLLVDMLSFGAGQTMSDDYIAMIKEDLGIDAHDPGRPDWAEEVPAEARRALKVVIVGAGMSGLCMAIRLDQAGIPWTILEKNQTVGGTWYENTYPGCGVDTPNHFYSFSFEPDHDWSEFFAKRDELWRYFERVADKYGLRDRIRFGREVQSATFDETTGKWQVIAHGPGGEETHEADLFITAVGFLNRPKLPEIEGRETFKGPAFHTAQWDQSFDWRGKRVALIGTGASGHQVGPSIAPDVEHLTIFQRSPHWVVPNPTYHEHVSDGKKWVLAHLPFYLRWYRFQLFWGFADGLHEALQVDPDWHDPAHSLNEINARHRRFMVRHMEQELEGRPDLLAKVVPDYPPYGKRILIDNHWFRMLTRDNVDLVTEGIARIEPDGVRTTDGTLWPADALAFATGFHASRMLWPMTITGAGGKTLSEVWGPDDATAYLGITVPRFPNMFILIGPNTGLAHGGNQILITEYQVRHVMAAIRELLTTGKRRIEVRPERHDAYVAEVDRRHDGMVWTHKGVTNWYRNPQGRVFAIMPFRLVEYWKMTTDLDRDAYLIA